MCIRDRNMKKPVIGYIAGLTAPKGRVMGHAGAIVSAYGERAVEKVEILHQRHIRGSRATRGIRVSGVESERSEEARHVRRRGAQRWRKRGGDDGDG